MVRAAAEGTFELSQQIEMEVWLECRTNAGKFRYTTHPTLALYLMRFGYQTTLLHQDQAGYVYAPVMGKWDFYKRMKYYNRFRAEAEQAGMKFRLFDFSLSALQELFKSPGYLIVLCNVPGLHAYFHHRLVVGMANDGTIEVLCPIQGKIVQSYEEFFRSISLPLGKGALWIEKPLQRLGTET